MSGNPCARSLTRAAMSPPRCARSGGLLHFLLEAAALALTQPTPDTEALVVGEGVLETLRADVARLADPLGVASRAALLREERLGIGLGAERFALPSEHSFIRRVRPDHARHTEFGGVDEPVSRCLGLVLRCGHGVSPP